MKTPEEIKKGLECCHSVVKCEQCPYQPECDLPFGDIVEADALAYIEQLEAQVPKWISVEDRLPLCGERVLISNGSSVFEAYLSISHKWVRSGIGWYEVVTHWMPLPEPPKEEQ